MIESDKWLDTFSDIAYYIHLASSTPRNCTFLCLDLISAQALVHYMHGSSSGKSGSGGPSKYGNVLNTEGRISAHEKPHVAPRTSRGAGEAERI